MQYSALNEQEHFRGGWGSDDWSFHEDQLWPLAESVKAGVGSIMCAYNRINQTYACENTRLLNDILRKKLDFQVGGYLPLKLVYMLIEGFHVVRYWAAIESLYASVMNSVDFNMPSMCTIH
jgi:beta-glucosidase